MIGEQRDRRSLFWSGVCRRAAWLKAALVKIKRARPVRVHRRYSRRIALDGVLCPLLLQGGYQVALLSGYTSMVLLLIPKTVGGLFKARVRDCVRSRRPRLGESRGSPVVDGVCGK